jgi:hypothetical protein
MQKRICQFEQERCRHQETLVEMSHTSKKTRDYLSRNKKKSAKRIMAAVLVVIDF